MRLWAQTWSNLIAVGFPFGDVLMLDLKVSLEVFHQNHIRLQPPVPRYIMPKILWIGETWNEWSELAACQIKATSSCETTVTVICRNIRSWIQDCRDHIWPVPVWESLRQRSQIWVNPPVVLVLLALGCHCWWYYPPNPDKHRNPKTLKQGALDLLPHWEFQEEPHAASLSITKMHEIKGISQRRETNPIQKVTRNYRIMFVAFFAKEKVRNKLDLEEWYRVLWRLWDQNTIA